MKGEIRGTGSCIPVRTLSNHEIAEFVDTSDEWIQERTGVMCRHVVTEETTVSMAAEAGKRALENAGLPASQIQMILVATISSDVVLPCTACEVQKQLEADNAVCFDLNAACTGYVLAYNTAAAYLQSGIYQTALVIGSECLSNLTNWQDRGTCILFGDGAGATVLKAVNTEEKEKTVYQPVTHSEGKKADALTCKSRHDYCELANADGKEMILDAEHFMQMDGQAVFKFAVKKVPEVINEILEENHFEKEEIDWYILHQANRRIVEAVAKRLGEPIEKFPMNMQEYGNTSSASIPILLDEMNRGGYLKPGQKIVMAGFGAGLTWGAAMLEW